MNRSCCEGEPTGQGIVYPHWDKEMPLSTDQAVWLRDAFKYVLDEPTMNQPTPVPKPFWE